MVSAAETASSERPRARRDRDPLARVLALGGGAVLTGSVLGVVGALVLHGAFAARGALALIDLGDFAKGALAVVEASRMSEVDVDTLEPEKKEEPEPPPPPEEKPDPQIKPLPTTAAAPEQPAPQAAQAGQALTAEPDPDEPLDFGDTLVVGPGTKFAGGTTASSGTSKTAVKDPRAKPGGAPGGTGTAAGPAPPPAPTKSLARNPTPQTLNWNCGFPAEADMEQIDYATVTLSVTVGPDGRAKTVSVLKDPGYGFGALARSCALRMRYSVGLDAEGKPITKTTPPFPVRFTR